MRRYGAGVVCLQAAHSGYDLDSTASFMNACDQLMSTNRTTAHKCRVWALLQRAFMRLMSDVYLKALLHGAVWEEGIPREAQLSQAGE
jgi:hypothetical protein